MSDCAVEIWCADSYDKQDTQTWLNTPVCWRRAWKRLSTADMGEGAESEDSTETTGGEQVTV